MKINDQRYPYTYACDLIRHFGPINEKGVVLNRSDASQIRHRIADILEIGDEQLAIKLADYYLKNQKKITLDVANQLLESLNLGIIK